MFFLLLSMPTLGRVRLLLRPALLVYGRADFFGLSGSRKGCAQLHLEVLLHLLEFWRNRDHLRIRVLNSFFKKSIDTLV